MTPLDKILLATPRPTPLQELRKQTETLRVGVQALVRARVPLDKALGTIKQLYFEFALEECEGSHTEVAVITGTHRNTVARNVGPRRRKQPQRATTVEQNFRRQA